MTETKPTEKKKQNLLTGAGVLAIAAIIVKLISAIYKIPLTNLLTVEGYAYFNGAYAIYNPLYAISMAGLPVAISKLVSQNIQEGRFRDATEIFHIARKLFFCVGLFCTALLIALAVPYSNLVKSPMNFVSVLVIAPCILFCTQMSSFRGYYEGMRNMTPTGVSQFIEAIVKLAFGLAATYYFTYQWIEKYNREAVDGVATVFGITVHNEPEMLNAIYPYSAAVAIAGVTLGSIFGLIYLVIVNKVKGNGFTVEQLKAAPQPMPRKQILGSILKIAIPISLTSVVSYLSNIIDDLTIRTRLVRALEVGENVIKQLYADSFSVAKTLDDGIANYLYGTHGAVLNIKNLIPTITLTLGISSIPVLSAIWTKIKNHDGDESENKRELKSTIETVFRVILLIAIPAGIGIAVLAEQILGLLYGRKQPDVIPIAVPMLQAYGFGMALFAISSPIISMLQAIGKTSVPLISVAAGSAVKILLNFILIANPEINIHGAPISTLCCYVVIVSINVVALMKYSGIKINFVSTLVKPLVAALFCGAGAYGTVWLAENKLTLPLEGLAGEIVVTGCAVCVGAGLYGIVIVLLKGIEKEDVLMLPKGEKIAKVLEKIKVLR